MEQDKDSVVRGEGYSLHPEPCGRILVKVHGGPWLRIGDGDYRDEKRSNLAVAQGEALHWVAEVRTLKLGAEPKAVAHRRAEVRRRVREGMLRLGVSAKDADGIGVDAGDCAVQDIFIDAPIKFTCICASYVGAWDCGCRPSLTLSQLCRVLGGQPATMRKIEKKLATGYLPDVKPLTGKEPYEVLLAQGSSAKLSHLLRWWTWP